MITIQALPRQARERHEGRIVGERELEALELVGEEVAEFEYRLVARREAYRPHFLSRAVVARPPVGTDTDDGRPGERRQLWWPGRARHRMVAAV